MSECPPTVTRLFGPCSILSTQWRWSFLGGQGNQSLLASACMCTYMRPLTVGRPDRYRHVHVCPVTRTRTHTFPGRIPSSSLTWAWLPLQHVCVNSFADGCTCACVRVCVSVYVCTRRWETCSGGYSSFSHGRITPFIITIRTLRPVKTCRALF